MRTFVSLFWPKFQYHGCVGRGQFWVEFLFLTLHAMLMICIVCLVSLGDGFGFFARADVPGAPINSTAVGVFNDPLVLVAGLFVLCVYVLALTGLCARRLRDSGKPVNKLWCAFAPIIAIAGLWAIANILPILFVAFSMVLPFAMMVQAAMLLILLWDIGTAATRVTPRAASTAQHIRHGSTAPAFLPVSDHMAMPRQSEPPAGLRATP